MNASPQPITWTRTAGIHANIGKNPAGATPTVGVAVYRCDCCGKINVAIACVHPDGFEVNVILPVEQGLDVSEAIAAGVEQLADAASQVAH